MKIPSFMKTDDLFDKKGGFVIASAHHHRHLAGV